MGYAMAASGRMQYDYKQTNDTVSKSCHLRRLHEFHLSVQILLNYYLRNCTWRKVEGKIQCPLSFDYVGFRLLAANSGISTPSAQGITSRDKP